MSKLTLLRLIVLLIIILDIRTIRSIETFSIILGLFLANKIKIVKDQSIK
jgi:hypothetical protein